MFEEIGRYVTSGRKKLLSQPLVVHLLVVIFGISAWLGINGIFVQLPLLVISAPEGWDLAVYIVVIIQMANIGPIILSTARTFCSSINETACIFVLLFMSSAAMLALVFFYDSTLWMYGSKNSGAMYVCTFVMALVGCTSSILFMPYLRNSNEKYLVSYFIGEGLSGVLPSVVAWIQGVGGNPICKRFKNGTVVEITEDPRFPPRDYFSFLFAILFLSFCTFGFLRYLPTVELEAIKPVGTSKLEERQNRANSQNILRVDSEAMNSRDNVDLGGSKDTKLTRGKVEQEISPCRMIYLYGLLSFICFVGNGFLPGIQTYSCLPYGNIAFHLTVTLANIANPLACLFALLYNSVCLGVLDLLSLLGMVAMAYAIYCAAASPNPPFQYSLVGVILIILTWVIVTGVISFLKLSITAKIRRKLGPKALIGVGIVMQSGSACGAIVSFVLIKYTTVFEQHTRCHGL